MYRASSVCRCKLRVSKRYTSPAVAWALFNVVAGHTPRTPRLLFRAVSVLHGLITNVPNCAWSRMRTALVRLRCSLVRCLCDKIALQERTLFEILICLEANLLLYIAIYPV